MRVAFRRAQPDDCALILSFIRALAEKTLHISHGTVTPYAGGYDYYLEKSGLLDNPDAMDQ